jgi:hypothetical protein
MLMREVTSTNPLRQWYAAIRTRLRILLPRRMMVMDGRIQPAV